MTKREREIFEIIKANPLLDQEEIGKILKIKRSTVAAHIASLQKKGYILGKKYIINEDDYVVGIGSAVIDIYGKSDIDIKLHYDHPSKIITSVGGVTRNILENISRLNTKTKLLSSVGNDLYAEMVLEHCKKCGIDTSNVLKVDDANTGLFMQVQDKNNDMFLALCDMSIIEKIDLAYIDANDNLIMNAKAIIIDPSLDIKLLEIISKRYKHLPIFMDPISDEYAYKIKPLISNFYCIKPNKSELEQLSGIKIKNNKDLLKAGKMIIDQGVKKLIITLGKDGCLYMDNDGKIIKRKLKPVKDVVNASGAGDSFTAAIIYGFINDLSIEETLDYALASGIATIRHPSPNNPDLSLSLLQKIIKENKVSI